VKAVEETNRKDIQNFGRSLEGKFSNIENFSNSNLDFHAEIGNSSQTVRDDLENWLQCDIDFSASAGYGGHRVRLNSAAFLWIFSCLLVPVVLWAVWAAWKTIFRGPSPCSLRVGEKHSARGFAAERPDEVNPLLGVQNVLVNIGEPKPLKPGVEYHRTGVVLSEREACPISRDGRLHRKKMFYDF